MINKRELCIGDVVCMYNDFYVIDRVAESDITESINPIAITEYLLRKIGFEFDDFKGILDIGGGRYIEYDTDNSDFIFVDVVEVVYHGKITSLHILQNLVRFVFGVELEIDLQKN